MNNPRYKKMFDYLNTEQNARARWLLVNLAAAILDELPTLNLTPRAVYEVTCLAFARGLQPTERDALNWLYFDYISAKLKKPPYCTGANKKTLAR